MESRGIQRVSSGITWVDLFSLGFRNFVFPKFSEQLPHWPELRSNVKGEAPSESIALGRSGQFFGFYVECGVVRPFKDVLRVKISTNTKSYITINIITVCEVSV